MSAPLRIAAIVRNAATGVHEAIAGTDGTTRALPIGGKPGGGSAFNGGELLMLALATCYCNDLYREAARRGIAITSVEVEASAEFPGVGLAARNIRYSAKVVSAAPADVIAALLEETDAVAEVHNTIRQGGPVRRTDDPAVDAE